MAFNEKSREENISRTALGYLVTYVANTIMQFIYRTIFIRVLCNEYLGIEGLFSNVIQLLSFAELGIGVSISYRLYDPIKRRNLKLVAEYMHLYKIGYRMIAVFVGTIGLLLVPFLGNIVKDTGEIPVDVNLTIAYLLFLVQSVTSYFFVYKQTLLAADQRGDVQAVYNCVGKFAVYFCKIIVLIVTRKYLYVLASAISIEIFVNYIISLLITNNYWEIFSIKTNFNKGLLGGIWTDIKAILCHRIGSTILNSTDNIVMSMYVGLGVLGTYSNYMLIITSVKNLIYQFLGNFNGSIGNAHVTLGFEGRISVYKKLHFINLWIANVVTVTMLVVLSPFISWWQGNQILLDKGALIAIMICFYLNIVRCVDISYTSATGLFQKDLIRPIIEAIINIIISIYLVKQIGVSGVVWGTIIAQLLTVWWRESYLIYKYEFGMKPTDFWKRYFKFAGITIAECIIIFLNNLFAQNTLISICAKAFLTFIIANLIMFIFNIRNPELKVIARQVYGLAYKDILRKGGENESRNGRKTSR